MTEDPLRQALDIAEQLIAEGHEAEALELLRSRIIPALQDRADAARRAGTGNQPRI